MYLKITHLTKYQFDEPAQHSLQQVRLKPKTRNSQNVLNWRLSIQGGDVELNFRDQHNNEVALINTHSGVYESAILSECEVETSETSGIVGQHLGPAPIWLYKRETMLTKPGPAIKRLVESMDRSPGDDIDRLHELSLLISDKVTYEKGLTHSQTSAEEAVTNGHGVCQDHAHIFISAARLMGYPARYVSGYLMIENTKDQEASHAWAEAHIEGLGWVGFDPSNKISPDEHYVCIATGLDYKEAAPINGLRRGEGGETLAVELQVQQ